MASRTMLGIAVYVAVLTWNCIECKTTAELTQEVNALTFEMSRLIHNHAMTVNYALGKPAFQSTFFENQFNRGPGSAVDGSLSGDFNTGTCIHTKAEPNPWWMVDLGANIYVGRVVIKNRADCCGERLNNFRISLGKSENGKYRNFGRFRGVAANGEIITVKNFRKPIGRFLKIEQNGGREILNFCEVQVFYE